MSTTVSDRFERLRAEPLVPAGRPAGAVMGSIREIVANRQLLDLLIRRDLKSRYKDSALGFLWTLIRPLVQLAIYYLVLGKILGAARGIDEFAIYVFSGLTLYGLFSEIVAGSTSSIVSNAGLIKKIYLPREIYPLASVGSALFNFVVQLAVLVVATIVSRAFPLSTDLLYFFPAVILILIWAMALGLLFAALNVYLRDMQYLVEVLVLLLMWASPIVYSWQTVSSKAPWPWLLDVYTANPITLAVLGFHRAFWAAGPDSEYPAGLLLHMGIAAVVGLVALFFCHRVFTKLQGNFAQEI